MTRVLYLVAYDITDPGRLYKVHNVIKNFSTGGQKSVYECFLTDRELELMLKYLCKVINIKNDRLHIFVMDGRSRTHTLGIAVQPRDPKFFFIG